MAAWVNYEAVVAAAGRADDAGPARAHDRAVLTITLVAFEALEHTESTEQAHMDGGQVVVERSSILVAVWDDRPARGLGGIADVVGYAGQRGIPVTIIWPEGASRD